jgi:hypothetical protein
MPELITGPSSVHKAGGLPRFCDSYMFPVGPGFSHVHLSRMRCASGWAAPEDETTSVLDKYILVLRGLLRLEHTGGVLDVRAGEGAIIRAGERVRASAPEPSGADFVVVVLLLGRPTGTEHQNRV